MSASSSSTSSASAKRKRGENVQIMIQIKRRKPNDEISAEQSTEDEDPAINAAVIDLKARLLSAQEALRVAQDDIFRLTAKFVNCKGELKRERYLNKIAWKYIPEDQHVDYQLEWPNGQISWTGSSSPTAPNGQDGLS